MTDDVDTTSSKAEILHASDPSASVDNTSVTISSSDSGDEISESLKCSSSTLQASNRRERGGRSRMRSNQRKKGGQRRALRTKFQIESLYVQIAELKRKNELLQHILDNIQTIKQKNVGESLDKLSLNAPALAEAQLTIPRTVQVKRASYTMAAEGDLGLDDEPEGGGSLMDDEDFKRLFYS